MRTWIEGSLRTAALLVLAGGALACAPPPPPQVPPPAGPPPKPVVVMSEGDPYLPSHLVGKLDDENAAPTFARRGDQGLLLYASEGRLLTRVVGADGTPDGAAATDVGAALDVSMPTLKPVGAGYLAVWVDASKNPTVKLLELDEHGKAAAPPVLVTQIGGVASWVDVLPNAHGALVLWEVTRDDRSEVTVVPVNGGKVVGQPSVVAHGVVGWEAIATDRGAALAVVMPGASPAAAAATPKPKRKGHGGDPEPADESAEPRGSKVGRVLLTEIDANGKPGALLEVNPEPTAQVDVELAQIGGAYVLAWSDERNIDSAIYAAAVQPGGGVTVPPHQVTPPFGEQALVSLVSPPYVPGAPEGKRALLAWEDQLKAPRDGRLIHLATIGPDAMLGKERATLTFAAPGPPDLVADGDGFAALTLAPASRDQAPKDAPKGDDAAAPKKAEAPVWPSFVRLGADLRVLAAEPIRADAFEATDGIPYLTRNLSCNAGTCTALASGSGQGAALAVVSLPIRKSAWRSPAWRDPEDALPRPAAVSALFDGDRVVNVAAAALPGGNALAAWVTYFLEGSSNAAKRKGKADEQEPLATLAVRAIGPTGVPGKPVVLSHRAVSIGGVAMAVGLPDPRSDKKPETVIAWVARDKNESQVFVTKVAPDGTKLAQKGVTTVSRKKRGAPSEASDVAIVADSDGFIVGWTDTRDGNAEIYVTRLDRNLNKVMPDRRITEAPGDSAEVNLALHGKDVILAWSDARQSPEEGTGDIYVARLDAGTLRKAAPEARVFASVLHSRTPHLTAAPGGYILSWIEDAFGEGKGDAAAANGDRGMRIARLDERGTLLGTPQLVRIDGQPPVTSSAIACNGKVCRGVLSSALGDGLVLDGFEVSPDGSAGPVKTLASLTGAVTEDVSPVFSDASATSLFFADDAVGGSGRVRWMQLAWP